MPNWTVQIRADGFTGCLSNTISYISTIFIGQLNASMIHDARQQFVFFVYQYSQGSIFFSSNTDNHLAPVPTMLILKKEHKDSVTGNCGYHS